MHRRNTKSVPLSIRSTDPYEFSRDLELGGFCLQGVRGLDGLWFCGWGLGFGCRSWTACASISAGDQRGGAELGHREPERGVHAACRVCGGIGLERAIWACNCHT